MNQKNTIFVLFAALVASSLIPTVGSAATNEEILGQAVNQMFTAVQNADETEIERLHHKQIAIGINDAWGYASNQPGVLYNLSINLRGVNLQITAVRELNGVNLDCSSYGACNRVRRDFVVETVPSTDSSWIKDISFVASCPSDRHNTLLDLLLGRPGQLDTEYCMVDEISFHFNSMLQ